MNIISSHLISKVKDTVEGQLKKKSCQMWHENRYGDRFSVCRDLASADLSISHLIISLASILSFIIASANVKGAYMQSGPIQRVVYVLPPEQINKCKYFAWRLQRPLYRAVEARRQWIFAIKAWLIN